MATLLPRVLLISLEDSRLVHSLLMVVPPNAPVYVRVMAHSHRGLIFVTFVEMTLFLLILLADVDPLDYTRRLDVVNRGLK